MRKKITEAPSPSLPENETFRIEKIKNGVLVHHTREGKDGSCSRETIYHDKRPVFPMALVPGKIKAPTKTPMPPKKRSK